MPQEFVYTAPPSIFDDAGTEGFLKQGLDLVGAGKPVPDELLNRLGQEQQGGAQSGLTRQAADRVQATPAGDPGPLSSQLAVEDGSPLVVGYASQADLELGMARVGVSGAYNKGAEYPFAQRNEEEAGKLWARTLRKNGYDVAQGPNVPERRRQLLDTARYYVRVRDSEWDGPDRERYVGAMFDKLVDEQVARGYEQIQGAPTAKGIGGTALQQELVGQQEQVAAAAAILRQQTPGAKWWLVRTALARAKEPANPQEQQDHIAAGANWFSGRIAADVSIEWSRFWAASEPDRFMGADRHSPDELLALTRVILGDDADAHVARAYEQTKLNYFAHKLGILKDAAGVIHTGTSPDGVGLFDFAAPGVLADLSSGVAATADPATANAIIRSDSKAWEVISDLRRYGDRAQADQLAHYTVTRNLALGAAAAAPEEGRSVKNPLQAMGIEQGAPLTPYEQSIAGPIRQIQVGLMRAGLGVFGFFTSASKELDQAISAIPGTRELGEDLALGMEDPDVSTALRDSTRTVSQALALGTTLAMNRGRIGPAPQQAVEFGPTGVRLTAPDQGLESTLAASPELRKVGPEGLRAVLEVYNDPATALATPRAEVERRRLRLNDSLDGKRPFEPGTWLADTLYVGLHDSWEGAKGMVGMVAASPRDAATLILGGATQGLAYDAVVGRWATAYQRIAAAARLDRSLRQVAKYHPETAATFLRGVTEALDVAVQTGDQGLLTDRLQSAAAVMKTVRNEVNTTGQIIHVDDFARSLAGNWSDVKGYLDDMGAALGSRSLAPTVVDRVREAWYNVTGSRGTPDKGFTALIGRMGVNDTAVEGLRTLLGTDKDHQALRNNIVAFRQANGRMPSLEETRTLLPQSVLDVEGVILAGKRSADVRSPLLARGLQRIFPSLRRAEGLAAIGDASETLVNGSIQAAVDDVALTRAWTAGPRGRLNQLLSVAAEKVDQRRWDTEAWLSSLHLLGDSEEVKTAAMSASKSLDALQTRKKLLDEASARLMKHDPRQPWRWPEEVHAIILDEITPDTMGMMLDADPGRWEGLPSGALWRTRRARIGGEALEAEAEAGLAGVKAAQADTAAARKNPVANDGGYHALEEGIKDTRAAIKKAQDRGDVVDPFLTKELADREKALTERAAGLRAGTVEPTALAEARQAEREARYQHVSAVRKLQGLPTLIARELNPEGLRRIEEMLRHNGASEWLTGAIERLEGTVRSVEAARKLAPNDNFFSLSRLPVWLRGKAIELALRNADTIASVHSARAGVLLDRVRSLPAKEYALLRESLLTGEVPSWLAQKYPDIAQRWELLRGQKAIDRGAALDHLWNSEHQLFAELFEEMRRSELVPDEVVADMKNAGYDPALYGLYERGRMIPQPGAPTELGVGRVVDGDSLKFRRHDTDWRVRIEEPGQVTNKFFPTEGEAMEYLRGRYGEDPVRGGKGTGDIRTGRTPYGDPVTIGTPIGDEALRILDPILGSTPETRLRRVDQAFRSLAQRSVDELLNGIAGLTMDEEQFAAFKLKPENRALADQFAKLPDSREAFGPLSGKWVHQSVLSARRRAAYGYDMIQNLVRGAQEALTAHMPNVAGAILSRGLGAGYRLFDVSRKVVVQTQVLLSPATWLTNVTTQIFSDYLAGSRVFSSDSVDTYHWAMNVQHDDPIYLAARRRGLVDGFFPAERQLWGDSLRDMTGVGTTDAVKLRKLNRQREMLLQDALKARIDGDRGRIVELEADVAATNAAVREAEMGNMRRYGRWAVNWFVGDMKDALGRPVSPTNEVLRRRYNFIDEGFKLMQFKNLMNQGMGEAEAAWRIRQFSQMYNEVPWWLRGLSRTPFGATIVSFPFEAARIMKNALLHEPLKTAAFFSAIPMANFATLASSGIPWDRYLASLDARGARDSMSAIARTMFSVWVPDGRGNIAMELDLGSIFSLGGLLHGRGALAQIYNDWFPPEQRGVIGHAAGALAGFGSNFFLNNAPLNFFAQLYTGNDPMTGRAILDKDASWLEKVRVAGRTLFQTAVPLGRLVVNLGHADDDIIHPATRRPFQRPYTVEAVMRGLANVGLKGDLSGGEPLVDDTDIALSVLYRTSNLLDPNRKLGDYASESQRNHIRELLYQAMSPTERADKKSEAWGKFINAARETADIDLGFIKTSTERTSRQIGLEVKALMEAGPEHFFASLPIDAQAAVLVQMDRARVSDTMVRDLLDAAHYTPSGQLTEEQDPDLVRRAVKFLEEGVRAEVHNPRLDGWLGELKGYTLPMAEILRENETMMAPVTEEVQAQMKNARRGVR